MLAASRLSRLRRAVLLLLLAGLAACGSSSAGSSVPPSTNTTPSTFGPVALANLKEVTSLTALGDSVPYGTACGCTPYPQLTADDIAVVAGHAVSTSNDAVPGYTSSQVLTQVDTDAQVVSDLQYSQAVTVEVGANDVEYSAACGTNVACYERDVPQVHRNLDAIVAKIRQITDGRAATIVLLDYWNVWLGGQYAQQKGPAYVNASDEVTASISKTIKTVAASTHCYFVDLRTAFKGPDQQYDETHLLAPDGDHPNAAGHVRIEQAIADTLALHA